MAPPGPTQPEETSEPGATRDTAIPTGRNTTQPIGRQRCIPIMSPLPVDPGLSTLELARPQRTAVGPPARRAGSASAATAPASSRSSIGALQPAGHGRGHQPAERAVPVVNPGRPQQQRQDQAGGERSREEPAPPPLPGASTPTGPTNPPIARI